MCLFAAIEFFLFWRTLIQNKLLHAAQRFGQGSRVVPTQTDCRLTKGTADDLGS